MAEIGPIFWVFGKATKSKIKAQGFEAIPLWVCMTHNTFATTPDGSCSVAESYFFLAGAGLADNMPSECQIEVPSKTYRIGDPLRRKSFEPQAVVERDA